ncbi:MAG: SirB2 family protein [Marinicellaceae bacterium]
MYLAFKHSHMLFVVISILLFEFRFLLKVLKKPMGKALKIIPHINDTFLLVTGVSLAFILNLNPGDHTWLLAKIVALFVYIGFGMIALKANGSKSIIAFLIANLTIVFMLFTAVKKTPLFFS